jgi:antitoxin (DNA-binding transcriptional repressor) of toxin-antitoxin stability system
MYNVQVAKEYTVAAVRERLAEALDEAERGEPVFIERRGVTYRLSVEPKPRRRTSRSPRIDILDPALEAGQWTWDWRGRELRLRTRRR